MPALKPAWTGRDGEIAPHTVLRNPEPVTPTDWRNRAGCNLELQIPTGESFSWLEFILWNRKINKNVQFRGAIAQVRGKERRENLNPMKHAILLFPFVVRDSHAIALRDPFWLPREGRISCLCDGSPAWM